MKPLDRWLQRWRIAKASRQMSLGARVLDVGCADGALFKQLGARIRDGVGIDPDLSEQVYGPGYTLIPSRFPDTRGVSGPFDVITMLAVLEHLSPEALSRIGPECARLLRPGGTVVVTVPSPVVDSILHVLKAARLLDGMDLGEHHGFEVRQVPRLFSFPWFRFVRATTFQFGLNHLFVFARTNRPLEQAASQIPRES